MLPRLFLASIIIALAGCDRSPYPHHKRIGEDVHLRLYMLGDGDRLPQDQDSVFMRLRISAVDAPHGSFFSTQQWYAVQDLRASVFNEFLLRMHEGDSMSLIAPAGRLPWQALLNEPDTLRVDRHMPLRTEASMMAIRRSSYNAPAAAIPRTNDPMEYEQELMDAFLERVGPHWRQWGTSRIHYSIEGTAIDTAVVRKGDMVTITYTGRRVEDGHIFDSTERNGGPLTFRFGDKDQVINGLEVAVSLLREGQEGEFLLPSEYAFGDRDPHGPIAPYTPVHYTVRLRNVQRQVDHP